MGGRRTETMERDAQMYMLHVQNVPVFQIAEKFGVSEGTVRNGIRRAIQDQFRLSAEEQRIVVEEKLNYLIRRLSLMLQNKHYMVGVNGKVAIDPNTGEPLIDDAPERQTILAIERIMQTQIKLLGLNMPVRHRVEITDKMDEEIAQLAEELARHGAGSAIPSEMVPVSDGNEDST